VPAQTRTGARAIEPEIGDQLPGVPKTADLTDRGQERRRADHVDARHRQQPPGVRRAQRLLGDQPVDLRDLMSRNSI